MFSVDELLKLDELEKRYTIHVLEKLKYNRVQTAKALGISIRKLRLKIVEWDLAGVGLEKITHKNGRESYVHPKKPRKKKKREYLSKKFGVAI